MTETKKMWSHMHGIVDVASKECEECAYPLAYRTKLDDYCFTKDGRFFDNTPLPLLISMEQAEKQGLVKRVEKTKKRRVKYKCHRDNRYYITTFYYESEDIFIQEWGPQYTLLSFVDDCLDDIDIQTTVEYEEVPQ